MHTSGHDCDNMPKETYFHWKHELIFFIKVELVRRQYHLHLKKKIISSYEKSELQTQFFSEEKIKKVF